MNKIENIKSYTGTELETVFFRPMLNGAGITDMGIRVLYNMPAPTTLHFWRSNAEKVLHPYETAGWTGSGKTERFSKTIQLQRIKAESSYSADEYFSLVYDNLMRSRLGAVEDLSGSDLEAAETALFREAIAENLRATFWLGKKTRSKSLCTFDGIVGRLIADAATILPDVYTAVTVENVEARLNAVWQKASTHLRDLKSEGQLALFVTSDVYFAYEESLEKPALEGAYMAKQNGNDVLTYKGIPLVDVKLGNYMTANSDQVKSFILLTDRRNLAIALNTSDFPGVEVRMWYNPDLMENRQRAVFMAGCDYLLPELVAFGYQKV